jgi:signal transduction histidine kinase
MHATKVLAHHAVAERTREVLSACQYASTPGDYARRLMETLAGVTNSEYAVWLNWPAGPESVVAETQDFPFRSRVLALCDYAPRRSTKLDPRDGLHSIAVAPVMFRSSITGVLAVANGALPYTPCDLNLLRDVGRTAVLEYEILERAEALGVATPRQRTADVLHQLRQPLGILEACAFYIDLVLPPSEAKAREQVAEMQRQLDRASGILDEATQAYPRCNSVPVFEEPEPDEEEILILTNSATSMVT